MEERFEENSDMDDGREIERKRRRDEMRRRKERQNLIRKWLRVGIPVAVGIVILLAVVIGKNIRKDTGTEKDMAKEEIQTDSIVSEGESQGEKDSSGGGEGNQSESPASEIIPNSFEESGESREEKEKPKYFAEKTEDTVQLGGEAASTYAVFIDLENDAILAEKNAYTRMNPASMTKVLTLLVAVEHIDDPEDTFTITYEMTDYSYVNGCSNAGFEKDETVTVRDLLYGTILPSGAEAAVGLATYVAGSHEAFVDMMNEKLEELGLADSAHFTNCVGVYDENHYCTVYDMAMIMEAALDNELCREVLSSRTYTTSETEEHPEGMILSNWFLRRIEDKDVGGKVVSGKTGFVKQSGSCAASYGKDENGRGYVCVTANAESQRICINDHARLYLQFMMEKNDGSMN